MQELGARDAGLSKTALVSRNLAEIGSRAAGELALKRMGKTTSDFMLLVTISDRIQRHLWDTHQCICQFMHTAWNDVRCPCSPHLPLGGGLHDMISVSCNRLSVDVSLVCFAFDPN